MVRTVLILAAALAGEASLLSFGAQAADMAERRPYRHRHFVERRPDVERNRVVRCSTSSVFGFFTTSDCGQGFDPLGTATN